MSILEQYCFKIRTITCFVTFKNDWKPADIGPAVVLGRKVETALTKAGYTVQTVRIATNPFPEWLQNVSDLKLLDAELQRLGIDFMSVGSASTKGDVELCPSIIRASARFSCSAQLAATDVAMATSIACCIQSIAHLGDEPSSKEPDFVRGGLGNFRFCAATARDGIPFFPVARGGGVAEHVQFAVGLENGGLLRHLLSVCQSLARVPTHFGTQLAEIIRPVQSICERIVEENTNVEYLGMDTSANPSLDDSGSVARALEALEEVKVFGGPGTLAAAAAVTQCLQNLDGIKLMGYCGLMLPLCEDTRLAELANAGQLTISDLLTISSVCGVGVDTVPIPGDCSQQDLVALLLDVAGLAHRWGKSLTCRVFPVPGKRAGDMTTFDFQHLLNARVLPISKNG